MSFSDCQSQPRYDVAILGARRGYVVPRVLASAGMLQRFYTDTYLGDKPLLSSVLNAIPDGLKPAALRRLEGRTHPAIPAEKVVSFDWMGMQNVLRQRRLTNFADLLPHFAEVSRKFCKAVLSRGELKGTGIYALRGAALELCQDARDRGVPSVVEQIGAPYWSFTRMAKEESQLWPGWQPGLDTVPLSNPVDDRERAEWAEADILLAPSQFVEDELVRAGADRNKIRVLPYSREDASQLGPPKQLRQSGRLHVLFAGGVSLMKGAQYLLEALGKLNNPRINCRLVGGIQLSRAKLSSYEEYATFVGHVPRIRMAEFYRWADVLVLPTLSEGLAMVQLEAMGHGVPVISTPNSGLLFENGIDGFTVAVRDSDAIAQRIDEMFASPELCRALSEGATRKVRRFDLDCYADQLTEFLSRSEVRA